MRRVSVADEQGHIRAVRAGDPKWKDCGCQYCSEHPNAWGSDRRDPTTEEGDETMSRVAYHGVSAVTAKETADDLRDDGHRVTLSYGPSPLEGFTDWLVIDYGKKGSRDE